MQIIPAELELKNISMCYSVKHKTQNLLFCSKNMQLSPSRVLLV